MKVTITADACGEFCYDLSEANVLKLIGTAQTMAAEVSQPAEAAKPSDLKQPEGKLQRMFGNYRARIPVDAVLPAVPKAEDNDGYKGFLLIECAACGKRKAFYVASRQRVFFCTCGCRTRLEKLRPAYLYCKDCRDTFKYMTNVTDEGLSHTCLRCGKIVNMKLNRNGDGYITEE